MSAAVLADWGFEASLAWEPVSALNATLVQDSIVRRRPLLSRSTRRSDVERREDVELEEASTTDVAALPGRVITADVLLREANKRNLASLIDQFVSEPLTWGPDEASRISDDTRLAASRLIELLPDDVPLPQIAPDGEGGIVMHWVQQGIRHILGGVEGWRLHFVVDAGQDHAYYIDDVAFSGEEIPGQILGSLTP